MSLVTMQRIEPVVLPCNPGERMDAAPVARGLTAGPLCAPCCLAGAGTGSCAAAEQPDDIPSVEMVPVPICSSARLQGEIAHAADMLFHTAWLRTPAGTGR